MTKNLRRRGDKLHLNEMWRGIKEETDDNMRENVRQKHNISLRRWIKNFKFVNVLPKSS